MKPQTSRLRASWLASSTPAAPRQPTPARSRPSPRGPSLLLRAQPSERSGDAEPAGATPDGTSPPASTGAQRALAQALSARVELPGGYYMTRRDVLKVGTLLPAVGSLYVAASRAKTDPRLQRQLAVAGVSPRQFSAAVGTLIQVGIIAFIWREQTYFSKAMSFVSPQAVLNALLPAAAPPGVTMGNTTARGSAGPPAERVAAFKKFIADLEASGRMQQVPAFPRGAEWFNVPAPLTVAESLRGKVTILDFWTYCCINCIHTLPELRDLEREYRGTAVAVVGVHSAKFDNEKDSEAIRSATIRYEIEHPVVNDGNMVLWRALGVSSWPTLAVVSPQGKLISLIPGEGHREDLDVFLTAALQYYGERGLLDATPLPSALERDKDPRLAASPLRYPGKVCLDPAGERLFIADSNNHRIVVVEAATGKFVAEVGGNGAGLVDGPADEAAFNRPQGLVFDEKKNVLYVADTEAHAVRVVDFGRGGRVTTLVGDGAKGDDYVGGKEGKAQRLNSPWDLELSPDGRVLYIAMAGQHQIWRADTQTGFAAAFSGDGYERNRNGKGGLGTSWAQPSGLSLSPDGRTLWVADSESSSVRTCATADGSGGLVAGGDPLFADNLFRFGDRDGFGSDALLQHPLAVRAMPSGAVYFADSYNHRIKRLDPETAEVVTVAGDGSAGFADGRGRAARFSEPGGLALAADGTLYVADTNNCTIRKLSPAGDVSTLALAGVPKPRGDPSASATPAAQSGGPASPPAPAGATSVPADAVTARRTKLSVAIRLPKGYHLTKGAGSAAELALPANGAVAKGAKTRVPLAESRPDADGFTTATAHFEAEFGAGGEGALARVNARVFYCEEESACLFRSLTFEFPVSGALAPGDGAAAGATALEVPAAQVGF
ncbi:unnamed protein product [Pedinophyceae sp. YPF-701]|nr:unnamed protein product [Pedinophyceae sp. YPF-701]